MSIPDRFSNMGKSVLGAGASGEIGDATKRDLAERGGSASPAAVHQYVRSIAAEPAPKGVRINVIAPGRVDTPTTVCGKKDDSDLAAEWFSLTPIDRVGQPEETAITALLPAWSPADGSDGTWLNTPGAASHSTPPDPRLLK